MARYSVVSCEKKRQKRRKIVSKITTVAVILLVILVGIALWIYWRSMTPAILDIAESRMTAETTFAINEAVSVSLSGVEDYQNFVTVEKDADGQITMLYANSALVNDLARKTAMLTQNRINQLKSFDIDVPLGTLSGIPLLSDKGPTVNIEISPIGTVNCIFTSVFESAGINQTLHRIYLNVQCSVDLIIPTSHKVVESATPILLCESLIVGKVPQTFLQGGLLLGQS